VAIIVGAATVPAGTTGTLLFTVPPSWCNVTFYNLSAATVWIGTSTAVTTANGLMCHSLPTSFQTFMASKGAPFYGTTGSTVSTSVATIQYCISTEA
jgi:hypothetical protein